MRRRSAAVLLAVAALAGACVEGGPPTMAAAGTVEPDATTSTTAPATTTTVPPETTTTTAPPPPPPPPTEPPTTVPPPPPPRVVGEQPYVPYAVVGPVTLHHPAAVVERIAFHESNHDGAQRQDPVVGAVAPVVLESRDRGNDPQTAADIVVDPTAEIRSPVTGTVVRGGGYTLYCDHRDEYVVIEPDARPGWEVKVLHIVGVRVGVGQRVVAGETVLADHARILPFASQVDDLAGASGPWPHTHVEVVDPSVPDRPGPGC